MLVCVFILCIYIYRAEGKKERGKMNSERKQENDEKKDITMTFHTCAHTHTRTGLYTHTRVHTYTCTSARHTQRNTST